MLSCTITTIIKKSALCFGTDFYLTRTDMLSACSTKLTEAKAIVSEVERRMRDSNPQAQRAAVFKTADLPISLILQRAGNYNMIVLNLQEFISSTTLKIVLYFFSYLLGAFSITIELIIGKFRIKTNERIFYLFSFGPRYQIIT